MKKLLLALLAVAAVAVVAVVIMENTLAKVQLESEIRLHALALAQRKLELEEANRQHWEVFHDFWDQFEAALCDCETARLPSARVMLSWEYPVLFSRDELVFSGHRVDFLRHPEDCNYARAWQDIQTTWGPYIMRKEKEFYEAQLNR